MMRKVLCGYTLIELLVTVIILVTVMTIAIPSFYSIIQNNRTTGLTNELVSSIIYARSEAIKRSTIVSICATQDTNFNSCGNSWNLGWLIFVNPDGNTTWANSATEPLLRIHRIGGTGASITPAPNVNILSFNSSGFAQAGTANVAITVNFTGCTGNASRNVALSATGRASITKVNCP